MRRPALLLSIALLLVGALAIGPTAHAAGTFGFGKPFLVDPTRAGGEPSIFQITTGKHAGEYLYASHAGTTHLWRGGAANMGDFLAPYRNQTFIWRSSNARRWQFVDIAGTGLHSTSTGFSDPDLTQDDAGNVYEPEIDLANVGVNSSSDGGQSWIGQPYAQTGDRPWLAAEGNGIVYLGLDFTPSECTGETIYKSTDHGLTFPTHSCAQVPWKKGGEIDGTWKIVMDPKTHTLYEPAVVHDSNANTVGVGVVRSTDHGQTWSGTEIAAVKSLATSPSVAVDAASNVYVVWNEGKGKNRHIGASLAYASSRNLGKTWSRPTGITGIDSSAPGSMFWPWAAGGRAGHLAVVWYQSDKVTNVDQNPSAISVYAAQIFGAAGPDPSVSVVDATGVTHRGIVCQTGTLCVATGQDRRLGDYLTCFVDLKGRLLIAYSDTTHYPDSPVSRPALVIQNHGQRF
jgi:hypothetical protein